MKTLVFSLITMFVLFYGSCVQNSNQYSKWTITDGWSYSFGTIEKPLDISLEYPKDFQKLSRVDYENIWDWLGGTGDMSSYNVSRVEFGRPIERQIKLDTNDIGSWSSISVTLDISDPLTTNLINYDNSTNLSLLETHLQKLISIPRREIILEKQTFIQGFDAYMCKYKYQYPDEKEPYRSRIFITTLFAFNEKLINLTMNSWENESEEIEVYYYHLLETFTISD